MRNARRIFCWMGIALVGVIPGLLVLSTNFDLKALGISVPWSLVGKLLIGISVGAILLTFRDFESGQVVSVINPTLILLLWALGGAIMSGMFAFEPKSHDLPRLALAGFYPCIRVIIWLAGKLRRLPPSDVTTPHLTLG